jgi:hypothetical protein
MNLTDPRTLCLILLMGAAIFLLLRTRGQLARQRRAADGDEAAIYAKMPRVDSLPDSLSDDLAQWQVNMHETARQLSAQLDTKLSLLQSLLADAERAAERLESALDRAYPTLPPGSQAESLRPAAGHARDMRFAPASESFHPEPTATARLPDMPPGPEASPHDSEGVDLSAADAESPRTTDRSRRREEVYGLADYGFVAAEIARRVGMPVGEVELMLSLRDSK